MKGAFKKVVIPLVGGAAADSLFPLLLASLLQDLPGVHPAQGGEQQNRLSL